MSDVGKRFRATRTLELEITLDEGDVIDQIEHNENAWQSAVFIAGSTPSAEWSVVNDDVEELT